MSKYRKRLPQLKDRLFMTDGGLETTLMFHDGLDLPYFAAFDLLKDDDGTEVLRCYFGRYAEIARTHGLGLVLESPTWRANPDWAAKLGYDDVTLGDANRKAIGLMLEIRDKYERPETPIVISGNLGPRGDGYSPDVRMSTKEARDYHLPQIETFAQTDADMVAAFTMNYVEEAIGIVKAAKACEMPVAISFTLETDGRLPSGDTLEQAIARADRETDGFAAYYMINCAHPTSSTSCVMEAHGAIVSAGCAQTHQGAAMPSWTRARISMRVTLSNWEGNTKPCKRYCRDSRLSAAVAERIIAMWMRSAAQSQRNR